MQIGGHDPIKNFPTDKSAPIAKVPNAQVFQTHKIAAKANIVNEKLESQSQGNVNPVNLPPNDQSKNSQPSQRTLMGMLTSIKNAFLSIFKTTSDKIKELGNAIQNIEMQSPKELSVEEKLASLSVKKAKIKAQANEMKQIMKDDFRSDYDRQAAADVRTALKGELNDLKNERKALKKEDEKPTDFIIKKDEIKAQAKEIKQTINDESRSDYDRQAAVDKRTLINRELNELKNESKELKSKLPSEQLVQAHVAKQNLKEQLAGVEEMIRKLEIFGFNENEYQKALQDKATLKASLKDFNNLINDLKKETYKNEIKPAKEKIQALIKVLQERKQTVEYQINKLNGEINMHTEETYKFGIKGPEDRDEIANLRNEQERAEREKELKAIEFQIAKLKKAQG